MADKKKIRITMEGGVIHDIEYIPEGVVVEIWDFDVDGIDEVDISTNSAGEQYYKSVYNSKGEVQSGARSN